MSDYTQTTFFAPKDVLSTGNPDKIILGAELDPELSAISTAIGSKYDSSDLADQATAEAGTSNVTLLTPLRLQQWADDNAGLVGDLKGLADPNADRLLFWDDSAGTAAFLTAGTGLAITGTTLTTNDGGIEHDNLSGFIAAEHVDHSGVSVLAGTGLSGGGTIEANRTFNIDLSGLTAMPNTIDTVNDVLVMYDASVGAHYKVPIGDVTSSDSGFVPTARTITGASGVTGGGDLSANRTLSLDTGSTRNTDHAAVTFSAGTGLTGGGTLAASRSFALDTSNTRNVDHASVTFTAGTGLTGGGTLAASRTFNLDISGLTSVVSTSLAGTDTILLNDGGVMKQLALRDGGLRTQDFSVDTTPTLNDANSAFFQTGATQRTFTVPPNASVAYAVGTVLIVGSRQAAVTVSPGSGVTINHRFGGGAATLQPEGTAMLVQVAANEWNLEGGIL